MENLRSIKPKLSMYWLWGFYIFMSFYEFYLSSFVGSVNKYYIILVIFVFVYFYKKIKLRSYHVFIVMWVVLKFGSQLWSDGSNYQVVQSHLISQIGMVLLFLVMTLVEFEKKFIDFTIDSLMYTSASMGLLSLVFSTPYGAYGVSRQVLTIFGLSMDPNNLFVMYLIGIVISLYKMIYHGRFEWKMGLIIIVNTYAGLMTASRGGILSLLSISFSIFVFAGSGDGIKSITRRTLIVISLSIMFYLISTTLIPSEVRNRVIMSDFLYGSERSSLWKYAIVCIEQRPILGWGWGGIMSDTHNTFLTMTLETGLIGLSLFLLPIFTLLFNSVKNRAYIIIPILLSGIIPSLFFEAISKRFFWNAVIISFMIYNSRKTMQTSKTKLD